MLLVFFHVEYQDRKLITDLPIGGGGNWKKKLFFVGGPRVKWHRLMVGTFMSPPVSQFQVACSL